MRYEDLVRRLPEYERKSKLINEIMYATALELESLRLEGEGNYDELFIDTAVKAIQIHAKDLGIVVGSNLTLKQQRELISAHYRATFEQTTEETIKNVARAFSNGDVEINETDTPGMFEIKFVGEVGIPDNIDGLKRTIAQIVPAHLVFVYTFMYNVWNSVGALTWDEVSAYTWNELLEEVLT